MTANRRTWGRDARRADADRRQVWRDQLTSAEQLARLVDRGHGHCAEATRLLNGGPRR